MKSRRLVPFLLVALLLALGGVVAGLALNSLRQDVTAQVVETLSPGVDVELRGIRFSEMHAGVRKYHLQADSAIYRAAGISLVHGIEVDFFDSDGRKTMHLRADEGDLTGMAQQVTLRGNVVLTGEKGFVLKTDRLTYRKGDDLLVTDATVTLTAPQGRLSGRGLVYYLQHSRLSLLHDVRGELGLPVAPLNNMQGES